MKKLFLLLLWVIFLWFANASSTSEIMTIKVWPQKVDCTWVVPQKCLVVTLPWQWTGHLFYDNISWFDYKAGNTYMIEIIRTTNSNPAADQSVYTYTYSKEVNRIFDHSQCKTSYNDWCNTCVIWNNGNTACTLMACSNPWVPYCIDSDTSSTALTSTGSSNTWSLFDPSSCKSGSYNDWCNNCRIVSWNVAACTEMYCINPWTPYCLDSLDSNTWSTTGMLVWWDKDIHGCIWSAGYTRHDGLQQCVRSWEMYNLEIADTPDSKVSSINNKLQGFVDQQKNLFTEESIKLINDLWSGTIFKPEFNLTWEIKNNKDNIFSVIAYVYTYMWWAHGSTNIYTFTFNQKTSNQTQLPQLFKSFKKWLTAISKNSYNQLVTKLSAKSTDDKKWISEWTTAVPANFQNFTLTTKNGKVNSITFYFDQYQVAPYVAGIQTVTIPLTIGTY